MTTQTKETWEDKIQGALADRAVNAFVRASISYGYKNVGIPQTEELVDRIFNVLEHDAGIPMCEKFQTLRDGLSKDWHGLSIKERWSEYYKTVEAPFIVSQFRGEVIGPSVLEVGTGRGLISMELLKARPDLSQIVQTDVEDYRVEGTKTNEKFQFRPVSQDEPLPFADKSFETTMVVYVLHHHPPGESRRHFLENLFRITKHRLIIFEDTFSSRIEDVDGEIQQAPLFKEFCDLSSSQQALALAFQCTYGNKVDGGGANIPSPCTFRSYEAIASELHGLFPKSTVRSRFLGIPRSKVYLNSEAVFVVDVGV